MASAAVAIDNLVLYGCWRSSASHRLQIGLRLKQLRFRYVPVDLDAGEQHSAAYRAINPRAELPALVVNGEPWLQSLSILEELEIRYPDRGLSLWPADGERRRRCRELSEAINSSLQPLLLPARLRRPILQAASDAQRAAVEQALAAGIRRHQTGALETLERWLAGLDGPFCLGTSPSLADVLLVPHLEALLRLGLDLNPCPRLRGIHAACLALEPFAAAAPGRMIDAPQGHDPGTTPGADRTSAQPTLAHKEPPAPLFAYLSAVVNDPVPGLEACRRLTLERFPLVASRMTAFDVCLLLRWLCRSRAVRRVLEVGVFTGSSSLALLDALPPGGELVAIECDSTVAAMAADLWSAVGRRRQVSLQLGDALELMPGLAAGFELIYLDAENRDYARYLDLALPLLAADGLLVFDNVLWRGRVSDPRDDPNAVALDAFNRLLHSRSDLRTTVLSCGDGVALVERRQPDGDPAAR